MRIITFKGGKNTSGQMNDCARYRNKVFCGRLGWDLNCKNGLEIDQFDREDAVYIYALNDENQVCGHARLLPTTKPYLARDVFPQLFSESTIPECETVWELSRFAATHKESKNNGSVKGSITENLSYQLLDTAVDYVRNEGGSKLISASPVAIERIIRRAGYKTDRAGPPVMINNQLVIACWTYIPPIQASQNAIAC